ncbi:hypothetical protein ROZALSC1DRAFT_25559, partial [Rozella allomycis CSF55]
MTGTDLGRYQTLVQNTPNSEVNRIARNKAYLEGGRFLRNNRIRWFQPGAFVMIKDDLRPPHVLKPFTGIISNIDTSAHEVEKILQHRRINNNKDEYLVKWKNLDDAHNECVQGEDFHYNRPIQRYRERRRDQHKIVSLQRPRP